MTKHSSKVFVLLIAFILLVSAVPVSGHDIVLQLEPDYVEGWNGTGGNPESALDPYDIDGDGASQVSITEFRGSSGNPDGNGSLYIADENSDNTFATVELNRTNHTVFVENPSSNITGTTMISGEWNTDNLGLEGNGFRIINEDGENIDIRTQHGWSDASANYPSGWAIRGSGVETNVVRESGLFSSEVESESDVVGNWTFWIDQSTGEIGLKSDNMNSGPLTTQTVDGWSNTDTIRFQYFHQYTGSGSSFYSRSYWDYLNMTGITISEPRSINGTVKTTDNTPIENANVTLSTGASTTTDSDGFYEFNNIPSGTYDVTANADGFKENTTSVTVSDSDVTQDIILESANELDLQTVSYLEHGDTAPYRVIFRYESNGTGIDVTDSASVTSADPANLTVNSTSNELEATGDTSVNKRILVTATYRNASDSQNVTVATLEMENIDILPSSYRFSVLFGDPGGFGGTELSFFVLVIATLLAALVTYMTTSFAGLGVGLFVMVAGWAGGLVSAGIVLVAFWMTIFVALNVSQNLDFPVNFG